MKNCKNFWILSGCGKALSELSWTQKCECTLEIRCSVFVSVCVWHTRLSREKYRLEFCIGGRNHMLQPYIESTSVLSDTYIRTDPTTLPCSLARAGNNTRMESSIKQMQ